MDKNILRSSLSAALVSLSKLALVVVLILLFGGPLLTWLLNRGLARQHEMPLLEGDLALFRQCLAERGGACQGDAATALPHTEASGEAVGPVRARLGAGARAAVGQLPPGHPARLAADTLDHRLLDRLLALHDHLRGHPSAAADEAPAKGETEGERPTSTVELQLSLRDVGELTDSVHRTTRTGGWTALADHLGTHLESAGADTSDREKRREHVDDHRRLRFIGAYLDAYLRNGRMVEVDAGGPDRRLMKVAEEGFVSREGSYGAQIPAFAIDLQPQAGESREAGREPLVGTEAVRIDYVKIGNEMLRVVLEAIFDAHEGLPAVPRATGRQLGEYSLPVFEPGEGHVDLDDLDEMIEIEMRLTTTLGATLGRVIRGIGPVSLDNEALEELIVTLVTTTVLKATQKATWCYYACDLDRAREPGKGSPGGGQPVRLRLKVEL